MGFSERLLKIRQLYGMTQEEMAQRLGTSKQVISRYEHNQRSPKIGVAQKYAEILGVPVNYLLGEDEKTYPSGVYEADLIEFPIIGRISAGYNGQAIEEETGESVYIMSSDIAGHDRDEFFVLQVSGNSMYPQFLDGDKVLIQRCESVDSGSIAAILYNGDEATLKKVVYAPGCDWMELIPINPEYQPKRIEKEDLNKCRVLGRVRQLIRKFD